MTFLLFSVLRPNCKQCSPVPFSLWRQDLIVLGGVLSEVESRQRPDFDRPGRVVARIPCRGGRRMGSTEEAEESERTTGEE